MHRISEGVEDGIHLLGNTGLTTAHVLCGDNKILGKSTVTVNADTYGILTKMTVTRKTVTASAANDMTLARYKLANAPSLDTGSDLGDLTYVLVTDNSGSLDGALRPFVPIVNVKICTADSGLSDFDLYLTLAYLGLGYVH
jgi:hypothetical protein